LKLFEKLKYISISTRISILLGVIILITMGTFSVFSLVEQKQDSIDAISNNSEQLSQTIEKILRLSMLKNRRDEVSTAINNIVGKEGIISVRILNHQGSIKFSSRPSEVNTHISQTNQLCTNCHYQKNNKLEYNIKNFESYRINNENDYIYNCVPIKNERSCYNEVCHSVANNSAHLNAKTNLKIANVSIPKLAWFSHDSTQTVLGFIEVEVSIKKVIVTLTKTRNKLIALTIILAIIASIITYFSMRYLVGKPVKNLLTGTKRVALGDFKNEIIPGKAEFRLLAESFNKMQIQLLNTQSQLIESEKLAFVGKLSDEIASQINNPLTGIIIFSEALLKSPSILDNKNDINIVLQQALKIRENIKNILSLTRYNKPVFRTIKLDKVLLRAVSVVEKFSSFRNIKIITGMPKVLPDISADAGLLEQVFLNLLLLSSDAMPSGGLLNISVTSYNNTVEINFTDTGKAISQEILQKIFSSEYTNNAEDFEEAGINLTVCRDIIVMHKGRINVSSKDTGNSINIKLPVKGNEPES
jgi:two-component system, NtrC family, sensor kinase